MGTVPNIERNSQVLSLLLLQTPSSNDRRIHHQFFSIGERFFPVGLCSQFYYAGLLLVGHTSGAQRSTSARDYRQACNQGCLAGHLVSQAQHLDSRWLGLPCSPNPRKPVFSYIMYSPSIELVFGTEQ